jgi:sugar lactone lactonase YvrE
LLLLLCWAVTACALSESRWHNGTIKVADGYEWEVFATGLKDVDNLARTSDGLLFATLEMDSPDGELVMINDNGKATSILKSLNRPDGLRANGSKLYILEESKKGRVIEYDTKTFKERTIARFHNLEGIAIVSDEEMLLAEDRKDGRLLKLSLTGEVEVLVEKLNKPEGIAVGDDGTVYIAETKTGRILTFKHGRLEILVEGINSPDQLAIDHDGALWISEDADPGRLLRYHKGRLETIVSGLQAPQGILIDGRDILFSEQKAARIIRLTKSPDR